MIIRVLLIAIICMMFLWFFRQRISTRSQAWGKIVGLVLFISAVSAVLFPDSTNQLARQVGVGRGADLLLYILAVAFFGALLKYYMYQQASTAQINRLARRLAILDASQHPHNIPLLSRAGRDVH